jgi:hypothetical protein
MRTRLRTVTALLVGLAAALLLALPSPASAEDFPAPEGAQENASCVGLGSSFYGKFATQQRALVAHYVNELAGTPGAYYVSFAQEKEGGSIPAPCGTRIE